jgi:hypothetical protein
MRRSPSGTNTPEEESLMLTRSSRIERAALIGLIAFMFAVTPVPAIADDRVEGGGLSDGDAGDAGTSAYVVPPTGYVVTYFFTGATTSANTVATSVHCSNITVTVTPVRVEFYDFAGALKGVGSLSMGGYRTATFSASSVGSTAFYFDDVNVPLTLPLNQGVVRVLKKGTGKIICTAQVLDAIGSTPSFVITLPHFGPTGLH